MLEEFRRDIFVNMIEPGQFQSDAHEIQAVHRHPTGSVGLVNEPAGWKGSASVKNPDVIKAQEPTLENVAPGRVFAIHPPGEIHQQLVKDELEKSKVAHIIGTASAAQLAIDLKDSPGRPSVDRRVYVAEGPFVGGQLTIRMHVPCLRDQAELALGKL